MAKEPHPFDYIFRLIQQGLALFIGDPRTPAPISTLRKVFEQVRHERAYLREVELGSPLVEEAWKALARIAPALSELSKQNNAYELGNSFHVLCLVNARIELCKVMEALCDRSSFNPRLSFAAIEIFRRNHLLLGSWDQHRLHVLAAFHEVAS